MQFDFPLIPATLITRYKRFLADVTLENGKQITVHCPNTGAMTGCAEPGFTVWLSDSHNPKRKYRYTWELSQNGQNQWIGINTGRANKLVAEAIAQGKIAELTHPSQILSEVAYGKENSRIDFVVEFDHQPSCYVEVKSVTLEDQGVGYFPDAVSIRGQKHLRELTELSKQGKRAMLIYLVQHSGISRMNLNSEVDPTYSSLLNHAVQAGVSIACYSCEICQSNIHLNQPVPFTLSASS